MALLALPLALGLEEDKKPPAFAMALFFVADKYLFLTWPAIVVLVAKINLAQSDGVWLAFAWLASPYIAFAPASHMTAGEEDSAIAMRAQGLALGGALLFALWPAGIFQLYGWVIRIFV
jgi:hypothetical protein